MSDKALGRAFTPGEAVGWLLERGVRTTIGTLAKWRSVGGGPPYQKNGNHVVYREAPLGVWSDQRLGPLRKSTSDEPRQAVNA